MCTLALNMVKMLAQQIYQDLPIKIKIVVVFHSDNKARSADRMRGLLLPIGEAVWKLWT